MAAGAAGGDAAVVHRRATFEAASVFVAGFAGSACLNMARRFTSCLYAIMTRCTSTSNALMVKSSCREPCAGFMTRITRGASLNMLRMFATLVSIVMAS